MHTIDAMLLTNLRQLDETLVSVQVRQLEGITPAEQALEAAWVAALDPVLTNLYWWPLRNGLDNVPVDPDELRSWLDEQYDDDDEVLLALLLLLLLYQERAVNIGGREALRLLGLSDDFQLTNPRLLARLEAQARDLATTGGEMSLVRTTVDHLAADIQSAREAVDSGGALLPALAALAGMIARRVITRTPVIVGTELARNFANGLNWVFDRNGVRQQVFTTRLDRAVCRICEPLHGRVMDVDNVPAELSIPIHVGCRCVYTPVTDGWAAPESVWRGE